MNPIAMIIFFGIIIIAIELASQAVRIKVKPKKRNQQNIENGQDQAEQVINTNIYPYKKKYLFSKYEYAFYKKLKPITDKYNLKICPKVRLADIVDVDKTKINAYEYQKYFNSIQSKHIDFVLIDKNNLQIKCAIELDDSSHNTEKAKKSDNFKNNVLEKTNIQLIRCGGIGIVEERLKAILEPKENF